MTRKYGLLFVALLVLAAPLSARADVLGHREASFVSNVGTFVYIGAGALLPLAEDGKQGKNHTLRAVDALAVSTIAEEALKHVVRERRPDMGGYDSFPSGHTTAAFTIATMQSAFHPHQAPLWYAGAALIGVSRVDLREHHWHDVIAGALIGFGAARWELSRHRGLLLQPWIEPDERRAGLSASARF